MTLRRYPAYKDSGVEWLGAVPEHWDTMKIKHFTTSVGGGTPSRDNLDFWDGDIPWVSPKDMKAEVLSDAEERITKTGLKSSATNMVDPGHLLMVVRSGILKHTVPVAINLVSVSLNQDMKALKPDRLCCDVRFLLRWIQGLNRPLLLAWAKQGATVESVESGYLENTPVPLPPIAEQTTIVAFLDRETAKIDALITEQRTLIELLKEKRQAVISHAVTKGLNPDVPMKDSGVEWLGDVPEHWQTGPLKRFAEVIDCKHVTVEFLAEGWPVVSIRELRDDWIDLTSAKQTSRAEWDFLRENRTPTAGDLIFSRNASVGAVGYVEPGVDFCMGQDVCLIRPKIRRKYLFFQLISDAVRNQIAALLVGATIRRMNVEEIRNLIVAWPIEQEQQEIADLVTSRVAELDELMQRVGSNIAILVERRSALISAAVTGKIDVRDRVAQEAA